MNRNAETGPAQVVHQVDTKMQGMPALSHAKSVAGRARQLARNVGLAYRAEFVGFLHDLVDVVYWGKHDQPHNAGMREIWARYGDALAALALEGIHGGFGRLDHGRLLALMRQPPDDEGRAEGGFSPLLDSLRSLLPPASSTPRCSLRGTVEELLDLRFLASTVLEAESRDIQELCWGDGDGCREERGGLSSLDRDWLARLRPPEEWRSIWDRIRSLEIQQPGLYWTILPPDLNPGLTLFFMGLVNAVSRGANRVVMVTPSESAAEWLLRHVSSAMFHPNLPLTAQAAWGGRRGGAPNGDGHRIAQVLLSDTWSADLVFIDRARFLSALFSRYPQDFRPFHELGRSVVVLWGDGFDSHVMLPVLAALGGLVRRFLSSVIVGTWAHGDYEILHEALASWELEGWAFGSGPAERAGLWGAHGWRPRVLSLGNGSRPTGRDLPCRIQWPKGQSPRRFEDLVSAVEDPRQVLCLLGSGDLVDKAARALVDRGVGSVLVATSRLRMEDRLAVVDRAARLMELKAPCRLLADHSIVGLTISFPKVVVEMDRLEVLLWVSTVCGRGHEYGGSMEVFPDFGIRMGDDLAVDVLKDLLAATGWAEDALWRQDLQAEYNRRLHDPDAARAAGGLAGVLADAVGQGDSEKIHSMAAGPSFLRVVVPDDTVHLAELRRRVERGVDQAWTRKMLGKTVQWPLPRKGHPLWGGLLPIGVQGLGASEHGDGTGWALLTRTEWYDPLFGFSPPKSSDG